jgi:hypothetical protein
MTDDRKNRSGPRDPQGPPGHQPHVRGWRQGDPEAETVLPGRDLGAGGQTEEGPKSASARK